MATYIQIGSTVTVGAGGAASMTFSSIPATYTDLLLVHSTRADQGAQYGINISFNGSSASFTGKYLQGNGSAASSGSSAQFIGISPGTGYTANTFGNGYVYIPNYAGSTNKSFSADDVIENNATTTYADLAAGLWSNTAAITSISIAAASANFVQYSTASLYGISKS